jgi:glycosyltransferase involved in cell wall biosynthesis
VIGIVVPVFNRRANLELMLASLERQTFSGFHVVVADDGSTDGTDAMVAELSAKEAWAGRLRRVSCGPNQGVRTGRARNMGAANLEIGTSLLLMADSDLVFQPTALETFADIHARYPAQVIYGAVEWLPPVAADDVMAAVRNDGVQRLRECVPLVVPKRIDGTFVGPELRTGLYEQYPDKPYPVLPQWALPLNSAWPIGLYWAAGGFDETMIGYGYQDMEFGARAAKVGATCLARPELWALHVWHPKPPKAMRENQRNLDRYLRRNGPNGVSEVDVDWSLWFHYHADRGGTVVTWNGSLWAISGDHRHRLALPDADWLEPLGHCPHVTTTGEDLAQLTDHGIAAN